MLRQLTELKFKWRDWIKLMPSFYLSERYIGENIQEWTK